jgi:hypothetical protein
MWQAKEIEEKLKEERLNSNWTMNKIEIW